MTAGGKVVSMVEYSMTGLCKERGHEKHILNSVCKTVPSTFLVSPSPLVAAKYVKGLYLVCSFWATVEIWWYNKAE